MNISLVIYLASVADGVQNFAIIVALCAIAIILFSCGILEAFIPKIHLPLAILTIAAGMASALIPSKDDVYKLAGVTDQQKALIDANGKVIQATVIDSTKPAPGHN